MTSLTVMVGDKPQVAISGTDQAKPVLLHSGEADLLHAHLPQC